ncbi:MAG: glycoside hydrolase family 20 zincin-like fold domain-containing protein, partial [Alphaproteobacteria bacterium]
MRRLWLIALLATVLLFSACGEEENDEVADHGELTFYESFESIDAVEDHLGVLADEDDEEAFVPGLIGSGYWLGDGNFILFPSDEIINPEHGTLEFWMLAKDNWQDGSERQILHVNGPGNFAVFKEGLTDFVAASVRGRSVQRPEHNQFVGWNVFPQWPSRWTHVALTWRNLVDEDDEDAPNTGELVLYVDGVVINQYVGNIPKIEVDNSLMLGAWTSGYDANIIIDELRVYSRAKAWDEFLAYDRDMPERELPYDLLAWPTPHPYGMRPGAGFFLNADTQIVVGDEDYQKLSDALNVLRSTALKSLGLALAIQPASRFSGADNFIAIGEPNKNGLVSRLAETRKLPVERSNPGPGGFLLEVYDDGIVVAGSDYAGTVHGLMTLLQMLRQHEEGYIPAITLVDYPDFSVRAAEWIAPRLVLDDEAKRRIRFFASLKLSHVLLRTASYLVLDNEQVQQEVTEFFAFARSYGLDPIPLIDTLSNATMINALCAANGVDCSENGDQDTYCPCEPYVYEEVVDPALRNIVRLLHPTAVHIGHDDVK